MITKALVINLQTLIYPDISNKNQNHLVKKYLETQHIF